MYIQDIEQTHESTTKRKYHLNTTKTKYKKEMIEAKDVLSYIYPNIKTNDINQSNQRNDIPIIHTNVSTYTQALM